VLALSSISSTTKKKKKKEGRERMGLMRCNLLARKLQVFTTVWIKKRKDVE
jgi:hypothetical protein